uniref:Uncharacterized protein n=1 Tax=Aegilops tauschii subsp. strangulata TaxID=200361 RepID=A0A453F5S4_AEGTS
STRQLSVTTNSLNSRIYIFKIKKIVRCTPFLVPGRLHPIQPNFLLLCYIKQSLQTQNNQSPAPAVDSFDYSAQPHAGQRQSRRHARGTTSLRLLLPLPPSI